MGDKTLTAYFRATENELLELEEIRAKAAEEPKSGPELRRWLATHQFFRQFEPHKQLRWKWGDKYLFRVVDEYPEMDWETGRIRLNEFFAYSLGGRPMEVLEFEANDEILDPEHVKKILQGFRRTQPGPATVLIRPVGPKHQVIVVTSRELIREAERLERREDEEFEPCRIVSLRTLRRNRNDLEWMIDIISQIVWEVFFPHIPYENLRAH